MDALTISFVGKSQLSVGREPVKAAGPGQILVRTRKSLISTGTECNALHRNFGEESILAKWIKYPFYPGYSNAGVVMEVGKGVLGFEAGDRVASRGGHGQYVVTEAARAVKIPEGVDDESATFMALGVITQNGVRRGRHGMGDVAVVVGLGLLGQLVTQYARLVGCRWVVGIDTVAARTEMARRHGTGDAWTGRVGELLPRIGEITGGRMADVVYDISGHAVVFPDCLRAACRFGTVVMLGSAPDPTEQQLTTDLMTKGLTVVGAHDSNPPYESTDHHYWSLQRMGELFLDYVGTGRLRTGSLVTHRFSPAAAEEAYGLLTTSRSEAMGVIFDWDQVA